MSDEKGVNVDFSDNQLGEFNKPVVKLLDMISDVVGGPFRPLQRVRTAKAEGQAQIELAKAKVQVDKILVEGQMEVSEVQQRGLQRLILEEGKKQQNIEDIVMKALPEVKEGAKPEEVQDDWYASFFDNSRLTSDEEVQMLWGKVLAGEVNQPGTFSRRLLHLLSMMSKGEARAFTTLCKYSVNDGKTAFIPCIYKNEEGESGLEDFPPSHASYLENMGLVSYSQFRFGYQFENEGKFVYFRYYKAEVRIDWPQDWNERFINGFVDFTPLGHQLARLCSPPASPIFIDYLVENWTKLGYEVTVLPEGRPPQEA